MAIPIHTEKEIFQTAGQGDPPPPGQLHTIKPTEKLEACCHIVPDPNILTNGRINPLEGDIMFSANENPDMSFMHNDFTQSNCIVNNDMIVGLIDWEMSGFIGW